MSKRITKIRAQRTLFETCSSCGSRAATAEMLTADRVDNRRLPGAHYIAIGIANAQARRFALCVDCRENTPHVRTVVDALHVKPRASGTWSHCCPKSTGALFVWFDDRRNPHCPLCGATPAMRGAA